MNIKVDHIQRKDGTSPMVKFPGCSTTLTPYMTRSGQIFTGLSEDRVEEFSKKLGMPAEALRPPEFRNATSPAGKYWRTFSVSVPHDGLTLDTSDPFDELVYVFLSSHHLVAKDEQHVTAHHRLVMRNEDAEAVVKNTKEKMIRKCYRELDKMSSEQMRTALRLLGVRTVGLSNEIVESRLTERIKTDPQLFISRWIDDKDKEIKNFIERAIEDRIITRNKNIYTFGTDTLAHSLSECVTFFKDAKNAEMYKMINQTLEAKQKIK